MSPLQALQVGSNLGINKFLVSKSIASLTAGGSDLVLQGFQNGLIAGAANLSVPAVAGASASDPSTWNNILILSTVILLLIISGYLLYLGFHKRGAHPL